MGSTGPAGVMGAQGPTRSVEGWTSFNEVRFDLNQTYIRTDEMYKVSDVVTYIQKNPSHRVGIDTFADPIGTDPYNVSLGQRRVDAVRDALINAGLPASKITKGGIGQARFQCSESSDGCRRVGMMIKNDY